MEELVIEKTHNGPYVKLDPKGEFTFEGRSILENPTIFYEKIFEWINEYFEKPANKTTINFKIEYMNSSSSKYITGLMRFFELKSNEGFDCEVNWYYEHDDESILELGQNYQSNYKVNINLIDFIEDQDD